MRRGGRSASEPLQPDYGAWVWLQIAAAAGLLLMPAFVNGFPFVFDDTADYLVFTPRLYRSPYYGLFLFLGHWNTWIWIPVIVQSLITSHLLWVWIRVQQCARPTLVLAASVGVLCLFSSLPFTAGVLMADAFTAITILAVGILALHYDNLTRWERAYFFAVSCLSIVAHVSHIAMAVLLLAAIVVIYAIKRVNPAQVAAAVMTVAGAILLSAAAIVLNNVMIHKTWALSPSSASFLLTNLLEYGPARRYLDEACPQAGYKICLHLHEMPQTAFEMLWYTPFYRNLGGFEGMRNEAAQIVGETVRTRWTEVAGLVIQLIGAAVVRRAPGAELRPVGNGFWMEDTIKKKFGLGTLEAYRASAQHNRRVPQERLKQIDAVVFPLSLVLVLGGIAVSLGLRDQDAFALYALVVAGFAINTVLCAIGSGVFDRYQARVTWLLPFAAVLVVARAAAVWHVWNRQRKHPTLQADRSDHRLDSAIE